MRRSNDRSAKSLWRIFCKYICLQVNIKLINGIRKETTCIYLFCFALQLNCWHHKQLLGKPKRQQWEMNLFPDSTSLLWWLDHRIKANLLSIPWLQITIACFHEKIQWPAKQRQLDKFCKYVHLLALNKFLRKTNKYLDDNR